MRIYSYFFHALFGLFLLGIALVALLSGTPLRLEMLPWATNYILLGGALFGLLSLVLALTGATRLLFLLWSVVVFVLIAKGFFFSSYSFEGPSGFKTAALLTAGSLAALFGAALQVRRKPAGAKS